MRPKIIIFFLSFSLFLNAQDCAEYLSLPGYQVSTVENWTQNSLYSVIESINLSGQPGKIQFFMMDGDTLHPDALPNLEQPVAIFGLNLATGNHVVLDGSELWAGFFQLQGVLCVEEFEVINLNNSFTVLNSNNEGSGSLREALTTSQLASQLTVNFNIPGIAPHRIALSDQLPEIKNRLQLYLKF